MLTNLLLGFATTLICLFLQLLLLLVAIRYYLRHRDQLNGSSFWTMFAVIQGVMLILIVGNLGQMAVWAWLFLLLGEFQQFGAAFYHSAVNFATLGYGDIVLSERYRLLGPLEAFNGVLMVGVSSAALITVFQDAIKTSLSTQRA